MSRWFRHYGGLARDEKLVSVAVKSRQSVERVIWVWTAILESASEISDGGRFDLDAAEAAYFLRTDEADICSIVDALSHAGRISSGVVVKWSDRQYESDKSADRQARYRERKRAEKGGIGEGKPQGDVTRPSRDAVVTAPDTDTDTDTDKKEVILSPKAAPKTKNGTRLDENWVLPKSYGDWALAQGLPRDRILVEATKMRNWSINAGAKGVKKDWMAAWQNWVQGAIDALPRGSPPQPNGKPRNIAEASARLVAQMKESTNANSQPRALSDRAEQDVPYLAAPNGQR